MKAYINSIKYVALVLMLLMPATHVKAQALVQADSAYAAAEYATAIKQYESLIQQASAPTAEIYYNLGCAYYKEGNVPLAVLNFARAHRLDPSDADISFNLNLARSRTVDKMESASNGFFSSTINKISHLVSYPTWMILGILFFAVGVCGVLVYRFKNRRHIKIIAFYTFVISFILFILSNAMGYTSYAFSHDASKAVLTAEQITVKSSPDLSAENIVVVHGGLEVTILQEVSGYYEIKLPDGEVGWAPSADVTRILPH